MTSLGIIVQARMESTRLPQKVVLPLINGYSILDIILRRLKDLLGSIQIVLATGEFERNKALKEIAERNKVGFFSGSENDVLKRFIDCANSCGFNKVIRICADNPFLDMGLLAELVSEYKESTFDYVGFGIGEMPAILSHFGFFAELIGLNAMVKAHSLTTAGPDLEHVSRFIYNNRDLFAVKLKEVPEEIKNNQNIRLTVDNKSDFRNAYIIIEELTKGGRDFGYGYKDVLAVISKLGPGFVNNMKSQIIENSKT